MAQINVDNLTFCYEGDSDNIFEHVSFSVDTDWKLGLIGRNGKGKTTFLKILSGEYHCNDAINTTAVFDYFPYQITKRQMELPIAEFLGEIKNGCEMWRVIRELSLLEESPQILYRPYNTLSLGQQTKALLAVLFSVENNFLLIDEPTNHLDCETREKVKQYLSVKRRFILASHDRDLLDACVDHVLVLNRKTIEVQSGNFSCWWENKQLKDQFAVKENEKHRKEIEKMKYAAKCTSEWADKNEKRKIGFDPIKEHDRSKDTRSYIGTKTRKMQSRAKQMKNRIEREIIEKEGLLNDLENPVDLKMVRLLHYRKVLVNINNYGIKYEDSDDYVFSEQTFSISQGERVALHGKNGCGKTTLIKRILQKAGTVECDILISESGVCETAPGLVISYISQDTSDLEGSIAEFCEMRGIDRSLFCSVLRQLDFERTQLERDIRNYSEGQKKKILLAASLLTPAHLYIWDEPLNYIDVFSRMQIEKLLAEYQPTMLFVEHDVRFRENVATKTIELGETCGM